MTASAAVALLALLVTGCSDDPGATDAHGAPSSTGSSSSSSPTTPAGPAPVATVTSGALPQPGPQGDLVPQLSVAVLPLVRTSDGVLLTLDVKADNPAVWGTLFCNAVSCNDLSGVGLVDTVNLQRYRPLRAGSDSGAVLTSVARQVMEPGRTYRVGAWFPLPQGSPQSLSVTLAGVGVVPGVPVTDGEVPAGLELPTGGSTAPATSPSGGSTTVVPIRPASGTPQGGPIRVVAPVAGGKLVETKGTVSLPADVLFAFDSAKLSAKASAELSKAATILKQKADLSKPVLVVGHTDSKGSASYNDKLSRERGASAAASLRRLVPAATFKASGRGANDPVAPNTTKGKDNPAGRALNRRVEVAYVPKPVVQAPAKGTEGAPAAPDVTLQPFSTVQGEAQATAWGTDSFTAKVYPVRRDGALALLQVDMTVDSQRVAAGSDYFARSKASHGLDAWSLQVPKEKAVYGVVHDFTEATTGSEIAATYDVSTQTTGYRPGRTHHLFAYLALPPDGTTTVDVDLGQLGVLKDVPVQD